MTDLTPDALATYTARYREIYNVDPFALHEPSMRAVVEMVIDRCAKEAFELVSSEHGQCDARDVEAAVISLKGPRP